MSDIHIKTVKRITSEGAKASLYSESRGPSFTSSRKTFERPKYAIRIDDSEEQYMIFMTKVNFLIL